MAKLHLEPRSDMFAAYTFKWPPSAHFFLGEGPVQRSKENHRETPGRKQGSEVQVERSLAIRTQDAIHCYGHFAQISESGCTHGSLCPEHSMSVTGCRHRGSGGHRGRVTNSSSPTLVTGGVKTVADEMVWEWQVPPLI